MCERSFRARRVKQRLHTVAVGLFAYFNQAVFGLQIRVIEYFSVPGDFFGPVSQEVIFGQQAPDHSNIGVAQSGLGQRTGGSSLCFLEPVAAPAPAQPAIDPADYHRVMLEGRKRDKPFNFNFNFDSTAKADEMFKVSNPGPWREALER